MLTCKEPPSLKSRTVSCVRCMYFGWRGFIFTPHSFKSPCGSPHLIDQGRIHELDSTCFEKALIPPSVAQICRGRACGSGNGYLGPYDGHLEYPQCLSQACHSPHSDCGGHYSRGNVRHVPYTDIQEVSTIITTKNCSLCPPPQTDLQNENPLYFNGR